MIRMCSQTLPDAPGIPIDLNALPPDMKLRDLVIAADRLGLMLEVEAGPHNDFVTLPRTENKAR